LIDAFAIRDSCDAPDRFAELKGPPSKALPEFGCQWVGSTRIEFDSPVAQMRDHVQRGRARRLVDLYIFGVLNAQLPSHS
jgi:hypothetical protein